VPRREVESTTKEGGTNMKSLFKGRRKLALAGVVAMLAVAGAAYAYWTTSGSGTGSGTTGTSHAVSVDQVGAISNLTPGSPAQAVDFKITNPDTTNQFIQSVTVSIASVDAPNADAAHPCTANDFTVVQPSAIHDDLTPGAHTYGPSGATLAMKDTAANQDGCKGATVNHAFAAA
jgi:hypothetical protein